MKTRMRATQSLKFAIILLVTITVTSVTGQCSASGNRYCGTNLDKPEWLQKGGDEKADLASSDPYFGSDMFRKPFGVARVQQKRGGEPVQFDLVDYMHRPKQNAENIVYAVSGLRNPVKVWTWGTRQPFNE